MIEIFHLELTRSLRVLWLLEELQVEYSVQSAQLPAPDDLKKLYSAGLLPVVRDNGEILIESMAICELLARRYGGRHLIPNPDSHEYADYLQWLWFGEATLTPALSVSFAYSGALPGVPRLPAVEARGRADFAIRMGAVDERLKGREYIAGDRFTLADIAVAYPIFRSQTILGDANVVSPNVVAYWERLSSRPAFQAAVSRT